MSNEHTGYRGVPTGRILQDDDIFRVECVKWHTTSGKDKDAVLKSMLDTTNERRQDGFRNEARGTELFRRLARAHPEWNLVVPRTYAQADTWSVRRFMKGEPILREGSEYSDTDRTKAHLSQLATTLAAIDRVTPDLSEVDDPRNSAPYDNLLARVPIWAAEPLSSGLLTPEELIDTTNVINRHQSQLEPRYAHGDLMPYAHVFARPDGRLAFIDFEHYSAHKPQYYDAAYCYAQMFVKLPDPRLAGYFMQEFLDSADQPTDQSEKFMPVLAQRAIRLFFDAWHERRPANHPQTQQTRKLLALATQGTLDMLVNPTPLQDRATITNISEGPGIQSA